MKRVERNREKLKKRAGSDRLRLSVFRSCNHVYAFLIDGDNIIEQSSSSAKSCPVYSKSKMEKAKWVGEQIGKKILERKVECYYDRGGYAYHGVVKCLADSAREVGVKF